MTVPVLCWSPAGWKFTLKSLESEALTPVASVFFTFRFQIDSTAHLYDILPPHVINRSHSQIKGDTHEKATRSSSISSGQQQPQSGYILCAVC